MGTHRTLIVMLCALTVIVAPSAHGKLPAAAPAKSIPPDSAQTEILLDSARAWKMRNKPDRERADLIKLLRAVPDHPQGLLMLGLLEIRGEHVDAAMKLLRRLKKSHAEHLAAAQLEEALRIAGTDRKNMAQVQLLARVGRHEEAAAEMRALFPKGPLGGDLAIAYFRVIGNTPAGWDEARAGVEKLIGEASDDTRYQIALAEHLSKRPATSKEGIAALALLVKRSDIDKQQVLGAWQSALVVLDYSPDNFAMYQEFLAVDPTNAAVLDAVEAANRSAASRRPWELREKADRLLIAGRADEAESTLKEALQLAPDNPWVRFDLARLYYKGGSKKQGRDVMTLGLSVSPDNPEMHYAVALYIGLLDEAAHALLVLNKTPAMAQTLSMQKLRKKLEVQSETQQAQALALAGVRVEALSAMARAETMVGADVELGYIVANAWIDLGDPARGIVLMRDVMAQQSAPLTSMRLLYAGILNRTRENEELAPLLDQLATVTDMSASDKVEFSYLRASLAAHRADDQRNAGNYVQARATLAPALEQDPENTDLLMALARVHVSSRNLNQARAVYQQILARTPNNIGARLALARAMSEAGDNAAARQEIETILATTARDDIETRMAVADIFINMNDMITAGQMIAQDRKTAPGNPRVLVESGRLAKAEGRPDEAMEYFRQAKADDEVARMERGRKARIVSSGMNSLLKSGTPGISYLKAIELPIVVRTPVGYTSQAFFHVDPAIISAGNLQLDDLDSLRKYGKVLALSPDGIASAPTQSARGTAIAVGYEISDMQVDVGTTPLGFPVSNIVGGLKLSRSLSSASLTFEAARRPVVSSMLSYAGARDPVSGEVWGGVTSNGATLRIGYDGGKFDAFLDLGYYVLTGKNVATNREFALRTGIDWKLYQKADTLLSGNVAITNWRYEKNLSYYTFGHGGYYSPQSYYSLAVQLRWTGRVGRWSYLLKGSRSFSVSREDDMPYYPTDSSLQAAGNSIYPGGSGHGKGYAVGSELEYQMTPQLFVGGRFGIDRSAFYTPNFIDFYIRFVHDAHRGAVPYPPAPVRPYSRF